MTLLKIGLCASNCSQNHSVKPSDSPFREIIGQIIVVTDCAVLRRSPGVEAYCTNTDNFRISDWSRLSRLSFTGLTSDYVYVLGSEPYFFYVVYPIILLMLRVYTRCMLFIKLRPLNRLQNEEVYD